MSTFGLERAGEQHEPDLMGRSTLGEVERRTRLPAPTASRVAQPATRWS